MIQIKKTILTLVALLAVTAGAWADETPLLTIEGIDNEDFTSGSKTFDGKVTVTFSNPVYNDGDEDGWYSAGTASLLTVAGTNGYTITSCKFYTSEGIAANGYTIVGESPSVYLSSGHLYTDDSKSVNLGTYGVKKIEVYTAAASSPSGPEVAWDKAKKTGSFTMPGGNVTLEPEYYPQAAVADGGVTAADADARATTDDPLVKVDATKLTGAKKLMYFVSNSGTTAPAYDAKGWTDQLPTAEGFTQQGNVYVWYYPVGTDEGVDGATATYSDGDILATNVVSVTLAAAPTYAVTFADGVNPEPPAEPEWTASPAAGVTKGQTVTVSYTGTKKVIGVKAEKKAKAPAADVTWDVTNVSTLAVYGTSQYEKEGIKLSGNGEEVRAMWNNTGDPETDGIGFKTNESGGFTFTAPAGKAFTKIEMTLTGSVDWDLAYDDAKLGTGWAFDENNDTVTWTGSAASTVGLLTGADDFSGANVKSIAFYLSE